jgi:uncharacterized membrane protein YhaH (DUF805 family)
MRKFYQGWLDFEGERGRLSYCGANLLLILLAGVILYVVIFTGLFTTIAMAFSGSQEMVNYSGLLFLVFPAIIISILFLWATLSIEFQRLKHIGLTTKQAIIFMVIGHVLLTVLGTMVAGVIALLAFIFLVFWPGKTPVESQTVQPRIQPTL